VMAAKAAAVKTTSSAKPTKTKRTKKAPAVESAAPTAPTPNEPTTPVCQLCATAGLVDRNPPHTHPSKPLAADVPLVAVLYSGDAVRCSYCTIGFSGENREAAVVEHYQAVHIPMFRAAEEALRNPPTATTEGTAAPPSPEVLAAASLAASKPKATRVRREGPAGRVRGEPDEDGNVEIYFQLTRDFMANKAKLGAQLSAFIREAWPKNPKLPLPQLPLAGDAVQQHRFVPKEMADQLVKLESEHPKEFNFDQWLNAATQERMRNPVAPSEKPAKAPKTKKAPKEEPAEDPSAAPAPAPVGWKSTGKVQKNAPPTTKPAKKTRAKKPAAVEVTTPTVPAGAQ
jgi:hypothetical protein